MKEMSSPEEDQAYGLLQEHANGFMVSQVGRREGRPAGLAGSWAGAQWSLAAARGGVSVE